jgi:lysozyme family protein
MNTDFDRCFHSLMTLEGGYSNDPNDQGGHTKYGISRLAAPELDIKNLTLDQAREWYRENYWIPLYCSFISDGRICFELFESAVNFDPPKFPKRATSIAQGALILLGGHTGPPLQIKFDGTMGPQTVKALNGFVDIRALLKLMNGLQLAALLVGSKGADEFIALVKDRKPVLQRYLKGWLKRVEM